MHMDGILWILLPVFVAIGSALLSFYIMEARMEVAIAKERESLAEARATIRSQTITLEERVKATEEATKRRAMDEFMQDFRVEERSYARESRSLNASKKMVVMQERLFFRNIPLSNWIEREMLVEEGVDLNQLPKESVFSAATAAQAIEKAESSAPAMVPAAVSSFIQTEVDLLALSKFVQEPMLEQIREPEERVFAVTVPAFGAQ